MSEEEWKILIGNMQGQLHNLKSDINLANEISAENSNVIHNQLDMIIKNEKKIEALEKKQFENSGDPEIIKSHAEQIAELKDHDIFKIWNSVRKGGKTTLDAILMDNHRIKKLESVLKEMILDDPMNDKMNHYLEQLSAKDEKPPEPHKINTSQPLYPEPSFFPLIPYLSREEHDIEMKNQIAKFTQDLDYIWFIMEEEGIFDTVTPGDYKRLHDIKKKWEARSK